MYNFFYLFLQFICYAFIGYVAEVIYCSYMQKKIVYRGFLFGPICPIYGYGAIILILFMNTYKNHSIKLFVYASIVFSAFEYFVGFALEAIFGIVWWDYTTEFFNLNGRICVITFHSLEDKICKEIFKSVSDIQPELKKLPVIPDEYLPEFKVVKTLEPKQKELDENNRARSAKLRVIERVRT